MKTEKLVRSFSYRKEGRKRKKRNQTDPILPTHTQPSSKDSIKITIK